MIDIDKYLKDFNLYPILYEYAEYNKSMSEQMGKDVYIWELKAFDELSSEQIEQIINLAHSSNVSVLIEYDVTLDLYKRIKKLETYIKNLDILLQDKGFYINKEL